MRVRLKHRALARLLAGKAISQNRWAQKLGLSRGHLSDLVNGRHCHPSAATRKKLIERLGVDFDDLFEIELPDARPVLHSPQLSGAQQSPPFEPDRGESRMQSLLEDLRHTFRTLRRSPAFSAVVVLTLALSIGANTAMFSVVNGVVLQPLPFPRSEQLLFVPRAGATEADVSIPDGADIRARAGSLDNAALFIPTWGFDLVGGPEPERLAGAVAEPEFFEVLQISPLMGRVLEPRDNVAGAERVAVVSEGFWKRHLGGAPDVIGHLLELGGNGATVVGVAPPELDFLEVGTDVWMTPAAVTPWALSQRGTNNFEVIARLGNGATLERARAELRAITEDLARLYPETNQGKILTPLLLQEFLTFAVRPALLVLLGAVGLVLLIACVNLSNLFLVRAARRHGEVGLRLALGSSRGRILRQLLAESGALSVVGGLVGTILAWWATHLLTSLAPQQLPRLDSVSLSWPVLLFAAGASVSAATIIGLIPAVFAVRRSPQEIVQTTSIRTTGGHHRLLGGIAVVEVTLACLLLVGAGLLLQTLLGLQAVDTGFESRGRSFINLSLARSGDVEFQTRTFQNMLDVLESLEQVEDAAFVIGAPLAGFGAIGNRVVFEGRTAPEPGSVPSARNRPVLGDYFRTLGIPILRGRGFTAADDRRSLPVAVVNRSFAERFWPGQNPLGDRIAWQAGDGVPHWMTIVGVAEDVKSTVLTGGDSPTIYTSYPQRTDNWQSFGTLVVQSRGAAEMGSLIREAIWSVEPTQPVPDVMPLENLVAGAMARERFLSSLLGLFAAVATLMAVQGIYGVLSSIFAQRRREIGIRIAVGASPGEVRKLVLRRGLALAAAGVVLGTGGALLLSRLLAGLLFGVSPTDPLTYLTVGAMLLLTAAGACYLPARTASRVDPVETLQAG